MDAASSASADVQVCTPSGSPKCSEPLGLATDFETGLLYVADNDNSRIDIFKGKEASVPPGTPGSFAVATKPQWIAVDNVATSPSHHDIYSTTADFKVKKFDPNGTLADEFGEQGDGTPEGCQLEHVDDPIAVGPNGDVYLADSYATGAPNNFSSRIVKFDSAGNCIGTVPLFEGESQTIRDLAVDSAGAIYVTVEGDGLVIRQYSGTGALVKEFEDLETRGLAVDAENHLFTAQRAERVTRLELDTFFTEYASAAGGGAILRRFDYALGGFTGSPGLAGLHTATGDFFASASSGVRYLELPAPGPVVFPGSCQVKSNAPGSVRATLQAEVNPEGKATEFRFEYEALSGEHAGDIAKSPLMPLLTKGGGNAEDFELYEAAQAVEPLEAETEYRCRVIATNADGTTEGPNGTFTTREPFTFGPAWSSEVSEASATINAEGNPNGGEWTGQIEYVTDAQYQASKFKGALLAPTPPLNYGSAEAMTLRSATLTGLAPGTLYHYRLRATQQPTFPAGLVCPDEGTKQGECPEVEHTFRTYLPGEAKPDGRGYELVSPAEKNSAEVMGSTPNGRGFIGAKSVQIQAGATDGESVTYTSWISFANAQAAPPTSQYLSRRTPSGWTTTNASPFGFQSSLEIPPYLGFAPDLGFGAVKAAETPLTPGCPADVENIYLYEAGSGSFRCLTAEAPIGAPGKFGYGFIYGGASDDGSRVFFKTRARYANAKAGSGANLYGSDEGQVRAVNVRPGQSEPVEPTPRTTFGAKAGEEEQTGQSVLHNAISADGSHAIWTYVPAPDAEYEASQLLDRINGSETVQIDEGQGSGSESGGGTFSAASKNGQIVYFTSPKKLISGVRAEPGHEDLYRYDFSKPIGSRLTDLTIRGSVPGDVRGVIGASEDGSDVYYVAGSAQTPPTEVNPAGQKAEAGKNNLYVNDGKNHFIAQLSNEDNLDWTAQPMNLTARVSSDGQHLAFLSSEGAALAHFNNTLAATAGKFASGQHCRIEGAGTLFGTSACPEAFLYDKPTNALTCASCNAAGSRPLGPALLPGWSSMSEGPRYLSADGSRLFFETFDRLLPADENNLRDVYEFERPGTGTCSASSPNFDSLSDGCRFLVSTGKSSDESLLIDASATGRDIFISTRSVLSGWDTNENFDVYDYRDGGGFPEPVPSTSCEGEAGCVAPAPPAPPAPNPATPSFSGPGNPKPKKAKKHHKRKHHKRAKHHKKGKKKPGGKKKGRAGR
jgi:hypothetical protein